MNGYRCEDHVRSETRAKKRKFHEWQFAPKDVAIIAVMALLMSGLTGLGAIMLVELMDSFLQ